MVARVLLLMVLGVFIGCGNNLARVEGTVIIDDQAVQGGRDVSGIVRFVPASGSGAPAVGRIDSAGRYALKTGAQIGIEPGEYLVGISIKKIDPPATPGGMPQITPISPKHYASVTHSGLRETVEPGHNTIDFALSSSP